MDTKDGNGYLVTLVVRLTAFVFFLGVFTSCSFQDLRQVFLVCATFFAVFIPGYLEMLPEGGVKHGSSCECVEADAHCEFGFWFEMLQRLSLLFPVLCSSIFLYYLVNFGTSRAIVETVFALGLIASYSAVFVLAVLLLVSARRR